MKCYLESINSGIWWLEENPVPFTYAAHTLQGGSDREMVSGCCSMLWWQLMQALVNEPVRILDWERYRTRWLNITLTIVSYGWSHFNLVHLNFAYSITVILLLVCFCAYVAKIECMTSEHNSASRLEAKIDNSAVHVPEMSQNFDFHDDRLAHKVHSPSVSQTNWRNQMKN